MSRDKGRKSADNPYARNLHRPVFEHMMTKSCEVLAEVLGLERLTKLCCPVAVKVRAHLRRRAGEPRVAHMIMHDQDPSSRLVHPDPTVSHKLTKSIPAQEGIKTSLPDPTPVPSPRHITPYEQEVAGTALCMGRVSAEHTEPRWYHCIQPATRSRS